MVEHFLGIDVGYNQNQPTTGLCLLTLDQGVLQWECLNTHTDDASRREDLRTLTDQRTPISAVGIDGPLAHKLVPVKEYRAADRILSLGVFQCFCKPGQTNSPAGQSLNEHATLLANIVLGLMANRLLQIDAGAHLHHIHDRQIVEAFPNAFLGVLLRAGHFAEVPPDRGEKFDYLWDTAVANGSLQQAVLHVAPQNRAHQITFRNQIDNIADHDHRAAFICALTAMCIARNQYVAVGDPNHGQIILPPHDVWPIDGGFQMPWAESALRRSIVQVRRGIRQYPNHAQAFVIRDGQHWL